MFSRLLLLSSFLGLFGTAAAAGGHNVLLPRPQEIAYESGTLPLENLHIRVTPSEPDDLFAAGELAAMLSARTGRPFEIASEAERPGAFILLKRTGNSDPLPKPGEKPGPGSREAYSIRIHAKGVEISSRSSAGVYYGVQTLVQMVEGSGQAASLPHASVRDWPSLAYRGFMMDMSHCQLPKIEELKKQLDFLARWKTNQYFFYNEATIQLDGYPLLVLDGQMTKDQVREIIEYGRQRHIDVIPCLELYGHTHDLFRLEEFADLAVNPHGGEFDPRNPKVPGILRDWVSQFARLFPSPFFHIGFDETWMLERQAKKLGISPEALYLEQFERVAAMVKAEGKIVMAWADMFEKYPSIISSIPSDAVLFPWHYSPLNDYRKVFDPFVKARLATVSTAAVKNWNWISPDLFGTFENIDVLLQAGRHHGTVGFLNTGWTDDTVVLMRMTLPGIAYGSIAAWQASPPDRARFFTDYTQVLYPGSPLHSDVAAALTALSQAEQLLQRTMGDNTIQALWADPLAPKSLALSETGLKDLSQARKWAEDAQKGFLKGLAANLDPVTLKAFLVGARMVDYACLKHIYGAEIAGFWKQLGEKPPSRTDVRDFLRFETTAKYHSRAVDMQDLSSELRERFREAWMNEYETFRLGVALGKWDQEFQYWLRLQRRIDEVWRSFRNGDTLPALSSILSD